MHLVPVGTDCISVYVKLDYLAPLYVKQGTGLKKVWICISSKFTGARTCFEKVEVALHRSNACALHSSS